VDLKFGGYAEWFGHALRGIARESKNKQLGFAGTSEITLALKQLRRDEGRRASETPAACEFIKHSSQAFKPRTQRQPAASTQQKNAQLHTQLFGSMLP
jgi:hypothetical protein